MMKQKIIVLFLLLGLFHPVQGQTPQPIKQLLKDKEMAGASFSLMAREIETGELLYGYDTDRQLIPASVMKLFTTAAALEMLGEEYRYETALEIDGKVSEGVLMGNLFLVGSGDPTLGSSHFVDEHSQQVWEDQQGFVNEWIHMIKEAGIRRIEGAVIADEQIFDTEGLSMKLLREDMGSYYGAGSYGISVFDNLYRLRFQTGEVGQKPEITEMQPSIASLRFHNYLQVGRVTADSAYIVGFPFSYDRYLYGVFPPLKERITLRGDMPDPALFLARYFTERLEEAGIEVVREATCYRILNEEGRWPAGERTRIGSVFSPSLRDIVEIINHKSHNLYADAVIKTVGMYYPPSGRSYLSSLGKGTKAVSEYWQKQQLNTSTLWMEDGSGLVPTNKVSAGLIVDLLLYMRESDNYEAFYSSLPVVGEEGSVRNLLKGSKLQGKARLKSGGMSRVRAYAGYIDKGDKTYAVAVIVNNYSGETREMIKKLEKLLTALF